MVMIPWRPALPLKKRQGTSSIMPNQSDIR